MSQPLAAAAAGGWGDALAIASVVVTFTVVVAWLRDAYTHRQATRRHRGQERATRRKLRP